MLPTGSRLAEINKSKPYRNKMPNGDKKSFIINECLSGNRNNIYIKRKPK